MKWKAVGRRRDFRGRWKLFAPFRSVKFDSGDDENRTLPPRPPRSLALVYLELSMNWEAIIELQRALALDQDFLPGRRALEEIYSQLGIKEEAGNRIFKRLPPGKCMPGN